MDITLAFWISVGIMSLFSGFNVITYLNQRAIIKANNANIEFIKKLDNQYGVLLHQANTKFTYLQQRRVQVIEEIYEKMCVLQSAAAEYISPGRLIYEGTDEAKQEQEMRKTFATTYGEFYYYFFKKKLYFPDEINNAIYQILLKYSHSGFDFTEAQIEWKQREKDIKEGKDMFQSEATKRDYLAEQRELHKKRQEATKIVAKEMPEEIDKLKLAFQKLLGIIEEKTS